VAVSFKKLCQEEFLGPRVQRGKQFLALVKKNLDLPGLSPLRNCNIHAGMFKACIADTCDTARNNTNVYTFIVLTNNFHLPMDIKQCNVSELKITA
jgi:hypothetical protein